MGTQERRLKQKRRIGHLEKALLQSIFAVGFLSVALLVPNALHALKQLGILKTKKRNPLYSVNSAIKRLKEKGLIHFIDRGGIRVARLTKQGEQTLRKIDTRGYKLKKPKRWDKKWRIIIFDIKEKRKQTRNKLRNTLVQIGFVHLQDSVWVYPHDCEDLIVLLKADFKIGKEVLYVIADSIENDGNLRKRFGL